MKQKSDLVTTLGDPVLGAAVDRALWVRLAAYLSLKSRNTKITYSGILNEWCAFLGGKPGEAAAARNFCAAQDLHAVAYINWLRENEGQAPRFKGNDDSSDPERRDGLSDRLSNATIAKKISTLRKIYRVMMQYDFGITRNPFVHEMVQTPSRHSGQKRPTEMVAFEKVRDVIAAPDGSTPAGQRDRAILAVLFGAGLRRSEALNLKLGDIGKSKKGNMFLRLRATKSGRDADQVLPPWAAREVLGLMEFRKREGASNGDFLFVNYRGKGARKKLSATSLYHLFKRYCAFAGVEGDVSPHSARATAITKLLEDGLSHRDVKEFSRHSSVQMVEVYDKRRVGVDDNPGRDLDY